MKYQLLNNVLLGLVLAIITLTLGLFALLVIRPIVVTTNVCKAVSACEYGSKVAVNGTGETKQLQEAFNDLSSRSKLFMAFLGDINKPGNVPSKLQSIYKSGKDALNCSWIGLMAFGEQRVELHKNTMARHIVWVYL